MGRRIFLPEKNCFYLCWSVTLIHSCICLINIYKYYNSDLKIGILLSVNIEFVIYYI